ncbi:MAG: hemerythrin domain-containing protein [Leptospiraceae bacterium]|nr:hemerythrin domain-containing protein [Leptospiraceae bacterium]MCP5512478.1 hemerythrin domain-containing protein [Leptospiraceae bacterium]
MLIDELKKDHLEIVDMLNSVKKAGIGSEEGRQKLFAAKTLLLSHLGKEDEKLYPFLKKEAENDSDLKDTLSIFAKDMEGITKAALEFFEKYSTGSNTIEFARDYGSLTSALGNRIRQEEKILYEEYNKRN